MTTYACMHMHMHIFISPTRRFVTNGWTAYSRGGENPMFQWGARPSATCGSAFIEVGSDQSFGAGGHYGCDNAFGPSTFTQAVSGHGYAPLPNSWTYMALTYGGSTNLTEILYVNGAVNAVTSNRNLSIVASSNLFLGGYLDSSSFLGGNFALGQLRVHDHVLSASDIANNFNTDASMYVVSPSNSPSRTPSITPTSSVSSTASSTTTSTVSRSLSR